MAPKSDKKFSEVFDAFGRANQSTQNRRDDILRAALSAPTAGLPVNQIKGGIENTCLLYTSPSPRDRTRSRMPSSA